MLNKPIPTGLQSHLTGELYHSDAGSVRVIVLKSIAEIKEHAEKWRELDQTSQGFLTYFQSYDWCHTWLIHQGREVSPFVLMVMRGGRCEAVWPLMQQTSTFGITSLRALGDPHSQYANILTRSGQLKQDELAALREAISALKNVDLLTLNYVPQQSPLHRVLPQSSLVPELHNEAAHFNLKQFTSSADYQAREGKSQRRMRRKAAALLSGLGEVRLEVLRPHMQQYAGMVAKCIAQKKLWLQRTGRFSMGLTHVQHEEFLAGLPSDRHGGDGALLFVLMAGTKPLAFEFGMLQRGHYYSYLGSFAWGWRHASPGSLQIALTIDWLIDHGVATFDLLGNPENYKQTWTDAVIPLASYSKSFTLRGAIYAALWIRLGRPAAKSLYKSLPSKWRSTLHSLRHTQSVPVL